MRHIVHITGLWHHRLKTVKLFLEPICVRFRVAKSPFFGAQFNYMKLLFTDATETLSPLKYLAYMGTVKSYAQIQQRHL